jgi:hypothetical protein
MARRDHRDDRDDEVEDDRDGRGRRGGRSRRGGGMPAWAWVLIALGGSLFLCCGGISVVAMGKAALEGGIRSDLKANAVQLEPGKEHVIGDVGVTVVDCVETRIVGRNSLDQEVVSDEMLGCVTIRYRNLNPTRNAQIGTQAGTATVTDDLGNKLGEVRLYFKADGQISAGKQIELRADEIHTDKVVFERPVPAAKSVTVALDATRMNGGFSYLKCTVPISGKTKK